MSDQNEAAEQNQQDQDGVTVDNPQLPLAMQAQYIKDISLENPRMPGTIPDSALEKEVGFFIDANKLEGDAPDAEFYEVLLGINLKAQHEGKPVYILEMLYGVRCVVPKNMPEKQLHPMLLIEVPRYAFPFVRQLVAEMVQNAGYPPFYMAPVDFAKLYIQRFAKKKSDDALENADTSDEQATA